VVDWHVVCFMHRPMRNMMQGMLPAIVTSVVLHAGAPGAAVQDEAEPAGSGPALSGGETSVSVPVEPGSVRKGDVLYSSMGAAGLAVVDVSDPTSPVVIATFPTPRPIKVVQLMDDTLLVILDDFSVMPLDITDPAHPVPAAAVPGGTVLPSGAGPVEVVPPPEPDIYGKVKKVSKGWVVLDVGSKDGVEIGMRFSIFSPGKFQARAIVEVASLDESEARGPLPPRGAAKVGDEAHETTNVWTTKHFMNPQPDLGWFHVAIDLKPIIGADRGAGEIGFLAGLRAGYQFKAPAEVEAILSPAGFGRSSAGNGGVFDFGVMGGVSVAMVAYTWGIGGHFSIALGERSLLLLNKLRIGSSDGFHFEFFLGWIVPSPRDDGIEKVLPTSASMRMFVPIQSKLDLYVELGGCNLSAEDPERRGSGWASFLMGLRTFVRGGGGSGTVQLLTGMGVGYVWDQTSRDEDEEQRGGSAWGLLLHLGLDWKV